MIRPATSADTKAIAGLIHSLAEYERLADKVCFDEEDLREHLFGPRPFAEVLLAEDGESAVDLYHREQHRIDLVILDRSMPRLSWRGTLRRLRQVNPQVRVLLASGYS